MGVGRDNFRKKKERKKEREKKRAKSETLFCRGEKGGRCYGISTYDWSEVSLQYNGTSRKLYFPTVGRQRR